MPTGDAYIHTEAPARPGAPLLVLLHGTGGDENQPLSQGEAARFFLG